MSPTPKKSIKKHISQPIVTIKVLPIAEPPRIPTPRDPTPPESPKISTAQKQADELMRKEEE